MRRTPQHRGGRGLTVYSNVNDKRDFENAAMLDIKEELQKSPRTHSVSQLFGEQMERT